MSDASITLVESTQISECWICDTKKGCVVHNLVFVCSFLISKASGDLIFGNAFSMHSYSFQCRVVVWLSKQFSIISNVLISVIFLDKQENYYAHV